MATRSALWAVITASVGAPCAAGTFADGKSHRGSHEMAVDPMSSGVFVATHAKPGSTAARLACSGSKAGRMQQAPAEAGPGPLSRLLRRRETRYALKAALTAAAALAASRGLLPGRRLVPALAAWGEDGLVVPEAAASPPSFGDREVFDWPPPVAVWLLALVVAVAVAAAWRRNSAQARSRQQSPQRKVVPLTPPRSGKTTPRSLTATPGSQASGLLSLLSTPTRTLATPTETPLVTPRSKAKEAAGADDTDGPPEIRSRTGSFCSSVGSSCEHYSLHSEDSDENTGGDSMAEDMEDPFAAFEERFGEQDMKFCEHFSIHSDSDSDSEAGEELEREDAEKGEEREEERSLDGGRRHEA